jgi:hypothetical protein
MKKDRFVRWFTRSIVPVMVVLLAQQVYAQIPTTQVMPDTAKMTYNQISQELGLFIYPTKNQSKNQQKQDEFACYQWAMEQSGVDPLNLPKTEVQQQTGPTGGAVVWCSERCSSRRSYWCYCR